MEYNQWKEERNNKIKFLYETGNSISEIAVRLGIEEKLVRSILNLPPEEKKASKIKQVYDVRREGWG
jgi:predicted transcriptional regulator